MGAETLESLTRQLDNLGDLRLIVRTMKALSAARIRQCEEAVAALSGYAETVRLGLHAVLREVDTLGLQPAPHRGRDRHGVIVFGSDHGLCGRFNEEIGALALRAMGQAPGPLLIATVGSRTADVLRFAGHDPEVALEVPASPQQTTTTVQQLLLRIDEWQARRGMDGLTLCYNRHEGTKAYQPTTDTLLPLDLARLRNLDQGRWPSRGLPGFSMDRSALLERLLNHHLFVSLYRACAESQASEHAARLGAMHAAQRNVEERLESVTAAYRRTRQEEVTAELLDVVSGFEAVSGPQEA